MTRAGPRARGALGRAVSAAAIACASVLAIAAAEWHGRSSRVEFHAPPGAPAFHVASVRSISDAFLVWRESKAHGRRLVVLTGRWSGPRDGAREGTPGAARASLGSGAAGDPLDDHSALYWSAHLGVVRAFDVVMPPSAFDRRVQQDAAARELRLEDGAFRNDLHGFWLRFSLPRAFVPPAEPALVVIEPTWFAAGAPPDPLAWLASVGVKTDLALVALSDPDATERDRQVAAAYARSINAPQLDLVRTP